MSNKIFSKKPTIIFSTYDDINNPNYGGGGSIAIHKIAKYLSQKYTVMVMAWDYVGKKTEIVDGVTYVRFGMPFLHPKLGMLLYQLFLPWYACTKRYDIWFESFCPPFTTAMLPLFTKKPVIGIVHMLASEDMERKYKLPFHLIEQFGIRNYKKIIVTSDAFRNRIKQIAKKSEITIISNGIDRVYETSTSDEKYVLFLGRIEVDQKGLDLLVTSFAQFNKKNSYRLIIAGTGEETEIEKCKKLIEEAKITDHVSFVGKVVGKTKTDLIRKASCLVVPSRYETYSIVSLEALAHKIPLVCYAINGLSWIPDNFAYKVKPFSTNAFAQAIGKAVLDSHTNTVMLEKGCTYAKQFTWESIVKQYEAYIHKQVSKYEK